jgi:hypothetical protein
MTLRSSLAGELQLVEVERDNTSLSLGASTLGVLKVKQTMWEMGYRINQIDATFDQDLVDALKKFAQTESKEAGASGKIDRPFLQALDAVLLGGDFKIPSYAAAGVAPGAIGPAAAAAAATALLPDILDKLNTAATTLVLAYLAFHREIPELTDSVTGKSTSNTDIYKVLVPALNVNFSFNRMHNDNERSQGLDKIATTLNNAVTYVRAGSANFIYAPPALVAAHGVKPNAYAYYRPTDKKIYFTNLLATLGAGGRWRATTHEVMHAAGINHGTHADPTPYWWNLDAYHNLTPAERLDNADNYVWFVDYCRNPFGRKQPQP